MTSNINSAQKSNSNRLQASNLKTAGDKTFITIDGRLMEAEIKAPVNKEARIAEINARIAKMEERKQKMIERAERAINKATAELEREKEELEQL